MTASANLHSRTGLGMDGAKVPVVGVGASWPEPWGDTLSIYIHHTSEDTDESIDFRVNEALTFYAAFGEMLGRVFSSGMRPSLMNDEADKLFADIDAPRRALGLEVPALGTGTRDAS